MDPEQIPIDVAAMAQLHKGIVSRVSTYWSGVACDLITKAPAGPHELILTPPENTLFLTRFPKPQKVIKRCGKNGDLVVTHPGWLLNFVAAGDTLHTIAPTALPEMDRLAISITPEAIQRLEINIDARQLNLQSAVGIENTLEKQLVTAIGEELVNPGLHSRLYSTSLTNALVIALIRNHGEYRPSAYAPKSRGRLASWQLRRVVDYLDQHLADDVSLGQLAALVGLSPTHFSRAFRASTGLPPHQYQLSARIEKAKKMLLNSDLHLDEIAIACGFLDKSHLSRIFRARMGTSPGAWRRTLKS